VADPDSDAFDIVETAPAADDESAGGDVISGRAPRPPVRWPMRPSWLTGLVAVGLLAGIGIGYLIGHSDRGKHAAAPATPAVSIGPATPSLTSGSVPPAGSALAEIPQQALTTGNGICSRLDARTGRALVVGFPLLNAGQRPIVLTSVRVGFPLGGLRQAGVRVGRCETRAGRPVSGQRVASAATVWLTLDLTVLVRCPAALPIELQVGYTVAGRPATQKLLPFPDLGQVPCPGCPSH
jgi:hypothetical protein